WRSGALADAPRAVTLAAGLAILLVGLTIGFGNFFVPLGWVAWGPRYMLPWMPSVVMLGCYAYPLVVRDAALRLGRARRGGGLLVGVIWLFMLPQLGSLFMPELLLRWFAPDAVCSSASHFEVGRHDFNRCQDYRLWSKHPILLDAAGGLGKPLGLAFAIDY